MYRLCLLLLGIPSLAYADPPIPQRSEYLQMTEAILRGHRLGMGGGWFKPSVVRHTWEHLATNYDRDADGRITVQEWAGGADLFAVIDRDRDGAITADDLDWSDNSRYAQQMQAAQALLRQADGNGNRQVSKEEWAKLFEQLARGKETLDVDDFRRLLFPPPVRAKNTGGMPSSWVLYHSLIAGEMGAATEGPSLNHDAPDFTLTSPDRKTSFTLREYRHQKPVVLIFGSFT